MDVVNEMTVGDVARRLGYKFSIFLEENNLFHYAKDMKRVLSKRTIGDILLTMAGSYYVTVADFNKYSRTLRTVTSGGMTGDTARIMLGLALGYEQGRISVKDSQIIVNRRLVDVSKMHHYKLDMGSAQSTLEILKTLPSDHPARTLIEMIEDLEQISLDQVSVYAAYLRDLTDKHCKLNRSYNVIAIARGYKSWGDMKQVLETC